jgi:hypothetical protein
MADRKIELDIDLDHAKKIELLADYVCKSVQEMKSELDSKNKQLLLYQITISNFVNENEMLKRKLKHLEDLCQIENLKDIDIV